MNNKNKIKFGASLAALTMILGVSSAHSEEVYLQAEEFKKTFTLKDSTPTTPISVTNAGFEDPVLAVGAYTTSVIGWNTNSGSAGTFNPPDSLIPPNGASEGDNTHFSYGAGSTLSQTLGDVLEADRTYTLSIDVGDRTNTPFPGYQVQLGVDDGGFVLLAEDNSSLSPTSEFLTSTVVYTALAGDSNLGSPLVIRLIGYGNQVNFDNVRFHYQPATGTTVTMWGYSECDASFNCSEPSSPGPQINVAPGDATGLIVHLRNMLSEPTSIMIAGQANEPLPVDASDLRDSGGRLRSFVPEATSAMRMAAIENAGFEDPVLAIGAYTTSVIGWNTNSGSAGTFNPPDSLIPPNGASEGGNTHFSYGAGSTLSQTLGDVLEADRTYTLSIDVGDRTNTPFPGYQVQLGVDDGGFVLLAEDNSSLSPTSEFLTSTVVYAATAADSNLGSPLIIRLIGHGSQVNFDNVKLEIADPLDSIHTYSWPNLKPGSYLYQSGSHVQLQVQMGLYGAMVHDAEGCGETNCAYSDVSYEAQKVLIYSEIDPSLHDPTPTPANATVDGYLPRLFLINGEPFKTAMISSSGPVTIVNAGFEDPVLAVGAYTTSVIGWNTNSGSAGTFNPPDSLIPPNGASEGDNTHFSYGAGSTLSQTLGDVLEADRTYTLSIDVGDRTNTPFPGYQVQLGVDDGGFVLLAEDNSSLSPTSEFLTSTVVYTALAGDSNLGSPLVIRLIGHGSQVNFDNVRLERNIDDNISSGDTTLLRLINAGLENRALQLLGDHFEIIAQDGRRAPTSRSQYNMLLPAGKSQDVLFTPTEAGVYPLFDRRLRLVNDDVHGGGMFYQIVVE